MNEKKVAFSDKLLPDQYEHSYYYNGGNIIESIYEVSCRSSGIAGPHREFSLHQSEMFSVEEMASNPISLRFLQFLVKVSGARRVLEIGTFIGISALYVAQVLPDDGEVVTIEKFDHFAAIAKSNFEKNGLSQKIHLIEGDACETIARLPEEEKFDMVFIDANKERYREYLEATEKLLSPKGMVVVDDVFFHGDALNATPTTQKGAGAKAALDYASGLKGWLCVTLPLGNGMLMMIRD